MESSIWGVDYMRENGSLLAHTVVPKTSKYLKIFFSYDKKMYPVYKQTENAPKLAFYIFLNSRD